MIVMEMCLFPLDKGDSLSDYVARSLEIIDRSGLDYRCHAMGTDIEGDFDELMAVVRECFHDLAADCNRIECTLKLDYRKDKQGRLESKIKSVEEKLGRPVRK
jgi:uncharacterized protein (TIGR00106 family)